MNGPKFSVYIKFLKQRHRNSQVSFADLNPTLPQQLNTRQEHLCYFQDTSGLFKEDVNKTYYPSLNVHILKIYKSPKRVIDTKQSL